MFFWRKLNSFNVHWCLLLLFYQAILHSFLSFGLICVFRTMHVQDQNKLESMNKMARRVIGCDQLSATQICKDLILSRAEHILSDSTHLLHDRFQLGHRGNGRILHRKIRTSRFSKSFVPSGVRLLNERQSTKHRIWCLYCTVLVYH